MEDIAGNLNAILKTIPAGVTLVAVSKFHPIDVIMDAYRAGQRIFGESRANELVEKAQTMPYDADWHFIGHLQTNKVRQIIPYVSMIHSIDSGRLLKTVNDEALRYGRHVDVLLQIHVAKEETKFGFTPEELIEFASTTDFDNMLGVRIRGVMGMASNVDDEERIRSDFRAIASTFDALANGPMADEEMFDTISMGMSHDYKMAIECGSNMVRIGTTIFGEREY
ncbi:MAG: YggS family pyridoxal phosphate-dependent enzyme [Muribaculum sp.]|nr:YggS family pyridoxal phosphate-dependent enzyme [Muribaculum sp.]